MRYLGPSTIILLINVIFYGAIFALSGCAVTGTFTPDQANNDVRIRFRDRVEVERICGKNHPGCHQKFNEVHIIYSVAEWCVLIHEIGHVIKGRYHKENATCKVLPKNGENK